jgi:hypothetical protein
VKPYLPALAELFTHVLRLCQKGGMNALGHVVLDGTARRANAAKPTHRAIRGQPIIKRMVLDEPARRRIFPARPTPARRAILPIRIVES